ncbi:hypothetical protein H696_04627 [Fonticula alba]|uniref:Aminopeptidase P N-terminal domain-containing protein n=1 Tax=Fonticula alba TaxID=691883 RepID=A0A058Z4L3_FONAL|nr:hypothetical protein H696_04627 [Fonticula alba]KCV69210.1 hypothetical protein H696_04627 [Fonticula alba]|eukprot:XP_009496781.1 hypothetical protein H696_04627 [Fonticula alba]
MLNIVRQGSHRAAMAGSLLRSVPAIANAATSAAVPRRVPGAGPAPAASITSSASLPVPQPLLSPWIVAAGKRRSQVADYFYQSRQPGTDKAIIVFYGSSLMHSAGPVFHPFSQDPTFLYLTGMFAPDCLVALEVDFTQEGKLTSTAFMPPRDSHSTLWEGERIGLEGAREDYGFDQALPVTEFIPYMTRLLSDAPGGLKSLMLYMQQPDHAGGAGSPQAKNYELVSSLLLSLETKFSPAPQFFNVSPAIERLRVNKDPLERTLIEEACFIGGAAMRDVMKFGADRLRAGRPLYERHLATQMLHSAALNGGETLSYVPVVAANGRSCVIHNVRNDQPLKDTDMVLMDAGAFFGGYRSDITRTWPVGGRFVRGSPQLDVYQAVLEVQEKVIESISPGMKMRDLLETSTTLLSEQLVQLGISPRHIDQYYPHDIGHFLGLDLHDTPKYQHLPLQPGMCLTIEPGLYFRDDDHTVPEAFRGIGVRIEDNIFLDEVDQSTQDFTVTNLTAGVPKRVEDIERHIAEGVYSYDEPIDTDACSL